MLEAWDQENQQAAVRDQQRRSASRRNMASSRTRNAANSTPSLLLTILDRLERSVSLDERITCLEDFISTVSLCSTASSPLGIAGPLTSEVSTQILSQATAHRRLATIMRQRTETFAEEDWSGRAETSKAYLELVGSGLTSSWRRLETSFLNYARIWILDHCVSTSTLSERTPIGAIDWSALSTPIQQVLSSAQTACLISIDGHMRILSTAKEVRIFQIFGKAE